MINENTKTEVINCATRHPHKNQTENNKGNYFRTSTDCTIAYKRYNENNLKSRTRK